MTVATPKFGMGAKMPRLQDRAFNAGGGGYSGDIEPKGVLPATPVPIWTAASSAMR